MADLSGYGLDGDRMAVKEIGMTMFPCRHWFSCHTQEFETAGWELVRGAMARHAEGAYGEPVRHGKQGGNWLPWPIAGEWGIDSGVSAVIVGCLLGYDEIWLAGMPCDDRGHFFPFKTDVPHEPIAGRLSHWARLRDEFFQGRVKSLSGNTKDILNSE